MNLFFFLQKWHVGEEYDYGDQVCWVRNTFLSLWSSVPWSSFLRPLLTLGVGAGGHTQRFVPLSASTDDVNCH